MDEMDWALLAELQANSRLSFSELSRRVHLSPPAVAERVRRLEETGVITGYHAQVDLARAGRPVIAFIRMSCYGSHCVLRDPALPEWPEIREIHRITGHEQLFDTVFVYENYPVDTAALAGNHQLAITEVASREYNHYPLSVQATPGTELGFRIEYDTDRFTADSIEALSERLQRVLVAMTADPTQRVSSMDVLDKVTGVTGVE